jgi:hypothetical protein
MFTLIEMFSSDEVEIYSSSDTGLHFLLVVGDACTAGNAYHVYTCGHTPFWGSCDLVQFSP